MEKNKKCISIQIILIFNMIALSILYFTLQFRSGCNNVVLESSSTSCNCKFPFLSGNIENITLDRQELILTPYIKSDQIETGRKLAFVGNWEGIESYGGFLTVNETFESNLFFWFFPSENFQYKEPGKLILYLQGGPSLSSLLGLFLETGPFRIGDQLQLYRNEHSWTKNHSMLYIDSPVGTGFSSTNSFDAFATNQEDVGRDLYEALLQFFRLFPEYRKADFYVVGTSYAAKYVPMIAYKIHIENDKMKNNLQNHINLKGLAIGSGYFYYGALVSGDISNYYYNIGFIDEKQKHLYELEEKKHKEYFDQGEYKDARQILRIRGFLQNFTGFNNFLGGSALTMDTPSLHFQEFLNHGCIQTALHVGQQIFSLTNYFVFIKFSDLDYMTTPQFELQELLNANYKVLIYNAQFDVIIPHITVSKFIYNLTWTGSEQFSNTERKLWKVNGEIAGFVNENNSSNLKMILIRNAGHTACAEQSTWCADMINRFTNGDAFANPEPEPDNNISAEDASLET